MPKYCHHAPRPKTIGLPYVSACGINVPSWSTTGWNGVTCPECLKLRPTKDAPDGAKAPESEELTEKEFQALSRWWG